MGERLKYGFYMALVKPLSWLPLWMLYGVSDVLRFVISNCMHYRRKVIRDILSSCYPEKSRKEAFRCAGTYGNPVETAAALSDSHIYFRE